MLIKNVQLCTAFLHRLQFPKRIFWLNTIAILIDFWLWRWCLDLCGYRGCGRQLWTRLIVNGNLFFVLAALKKKKRKRKWFYFCALNSSRKKMKLEIWWRNGLTALHRFVRQSYWRHLFLNLSSFLISLSWSCCGHSVKLLKLVIKCSQLFSVRIVTIHTTIKNQTSKIRQSKIELFEIGTKNK